MSDSPGRLERAIKTLNRAAAEERIEPESTLGVWVASQREVLTALYEQEQDRNAQIQALIENARTTADTLLEAGRRASDEVRLELRKIDRCIELAETRIEEKLAESAKRMAGLLAQEIKGVMVIRAKAYNREHAARLAGVGVLVFLAILLAGVVFDRTALARREPDSIAETCRGRVTLEPNSGKSYCIIEMSPPSSSGR